MHKCKFLALCLSLSMLLASCGKASAAQDSADEPLENDVIAQAPYEIEFKLGRGVQLGGADK